MTLSMGISEELAHDDPEPLVAAADRRLYEAKRNGKNRVVYRA